MTPTLIDHIKAMEGWRPKAYLCPAGVWTIGWGRTGGVRKGDRTTEEREIPWLLNKLSECSAQALAMSPILAQHNGNRLAAIESFIYNVGPGAYRKSTLRKRVDAGDWEGAAAEMRRWVYAGGKMLPGLVTRREIEAQWLSRN